MNEITEFRRNIEFIKENINGLYKIIQGNPQIAIENEKLDSLIRRTLEVFLDFKILQNPELYDANKVEIFNIVNQIIKTSKDQNIILKLKLMIQACTNGWNTDSFAVGLLNAKIGRRMGLGNVERNIQSVLDEDTMVLETRIKKIKELFEKTKNKKVLQIIVNFFETYKKLCISGRNFQDVISYTCLVNILDNLLVALAALNMNDHLISMISLLPLMERLRILRKHHADRGNPANSIGLHFLKKSFVIFEILKSLLNDEFRKPNNEQNVLKINLCIQYLLDFAANDYLINRNLETILMMPVGMNVNTEYYYLAANSLRVKLPNKHEILVLKLYITGLSLDLSKLEDMKFDKSLTAEDYKKVYQRIYLVLIILSSLIQDPVVKRQCVKVANVFETSNDGICRQLSQTLNMAYLPGEGLSYDKKKQVLEDLRNILGNFNLEIKNNIKMIHQLKKILPESFENFKYFNNQSRGVQKRLSPIHYPGIEAGFGRSDDSDSDDSTMKVTSSEEVRGNRNSINYAEIHGRNRQFFQNISNRLKSIKDPELHPTENRTEKQYDSKQIRELYLNTVPLCTDFIVKDGQLYFKLSIIEQNHIDAYNQYSSSLMDDLIKISDRFLMHDFSYKSGKYEIANIDLDAHYNLGKINVWQLASNNFSFYDISNVLFYSIVHKKAIFDTDVLKMFNQNNNEVSGQPLKTVINYMVSKGQPEHSRLVRLITSLRTYKCMIEYNVENYHYNINDKSKFKFTRKKTKGLGENNTAEIKQAPETSALAETPMDCSTSEKSIPPVPTEVNASTPTKSDNPIVKSKSKTDFEIADSKYLHRQQQLRAHGVDKLQDVIRNMKVIQNSLSLTIGRKLKFDLSNFENLKIVYHKKEEDVISKIPVVVHHKNHKAEQRNSTKYSAINIKLPEKIEASFEINMDESHELSYDEKTHEPYVKTSIVLRKIYSHIYMLNTLTTFRCEVDIFEGSSNKGKIKITSRLDARMVTRRQKPKSEMERAERSDSFEQSNPNDFYLNFGEIPVKTELEEYAMGNSASTSSICTRSSKETSVIQTTQSGISQINQTPPVEIKAEIVNYENPSMTSLQVPNVIPSNSTELQNQMSTSTQVVQQNVPSFNQQNFPTIDGNAPMRETSVIRISPKKTQNESTYDDVKNFELKKLLNQPQSIMSPEMVSNINMHPVVVISRDDVIMSRHLSSTMENTQINKPITTQEVPFVQQSLLRSTLNDSRNVSYPNVTENTSRIDVPQNNISNIINTQINMNPAMNIPNIKRKLNNEFVNETVGNTFSQLQLPVQPLPGFQQFSSFRNTSNTNKKVRSESHSNVLENKNMNPALVTSRSRVITHPPAITAQSVNDSLLNTMVQSSNVIETMNYQTFQQQPKINEGVANTNPETVTSRSRVVPYQPAITVQSVNSPVLATSVQRPNIMESKNISTLYQQSRINEFSNMIPAVTSRSYVLSDHPSTAVVSTQIGNVLQSPVKHITSNVNKSTQIANRKSESNIARSSSTSSPRPINKNSPAMGKQDVAVHSSLSVSDYSNIIRNTLEVGTNPKETALQPVQSAQTQGFFDPNLSAMMSSHIQIMSDPKITSNAYVALPKLEMPISHQSPMPTSSSNTKNTTVAVSEKQSKMTYPIVPNPIHTSMEVYPKPEIAIPQEKLITPVSSSNVDNKSPLKQEVSTTNPPKIVIQEDILICPKRKDTLPLNAGQNIDKGVTDFEELLESNITVLIKTPEQQQMEKERAREQAEKRRKDAEMRAKIEAERKLAEKRKQELAEIHFIEMLEQKKKEKEEKELEEQRKKKLQEDKDLKKIKEVRENNQRLLELRRQNEIREKFLKIEELKLKANVSKDNLTHIQKPINLKGLQVGAESNIRMKLTPSTSEPYKKLVKNPFNPLHRTKTKSNHKKIGLKPRECSVKLRDYFEKIDKSKLGYDKIFLIKGGRTGRFTPNISTTANIHPSTSASSSPQPALDELNSILPD